jgi:anti-anti-sigma factor
VSAHRRRRRSEFTQDRWRRRRSRSTRGKVDTTNQGSAFSIKQEERDDRYKLVLSGELDLAAAPEVEAAITRLCTAGATEIEIDLRGLILMDSCGLRAILRAQARCAEHHTEFFVVVGKHPAQSVFELTQLALPWRDARADRI